MKVLLLNGSPHPQGCTYTVLTEVAGVLQKNEIETEILTLPKGPVQGCAACGACAKTGRCAFEDHVNPWAEKVRQADGLVVGVPVHYAGIPGAMKATLDRLFFSAGSGFALRPGAGLVCARRGGCTATFDGLNKYFTISNMPVVPSQYWNQAHGSNPQQVQEDAEGMQIMRVLGQNMAWLLHSIRLGREAGLLPPEYEPKLRTNFIR